MELKTKARSMSGPFIRFFAAAVITLSGILPTLVSAATLNLGKGEPPVKLPADSPALAMQKAFSDVAASVGPAVVNISSEWTENIQNPNNFGDMDQFFNYFFYGPHGMQRAPQQMLKQKQRSLGSGFLITSDGYILTNAHVIGKAEKITVTFNNGTTYPAKIVGKDEKIDIAVVKITDATKKFPTVVLGDSDALKVGDWAVAIGDPFAFDHTVTTGIISAKGRTVEVNQQSGMQSYIQTDASINMGNSGGPLCNIQGEVIGINSAIYSQTGGSVGIGFAIPANIARKAAEDLVNEGKVIRAGLGAMVQSLNPKLAKSFGLSSTEGALLSSISPKSAAEKAGLKPGDIVLAVNGENLANSADLVAKLYTYKPGVTVQLTILRNGKESQIPVTLQALEAKTPNLGQLAPGNENAPDMTAPNQNLGFTFQDQTADIVSQLPPGAPKGPVITNVEQQSPAQSGGLMPGDIVLKVGDTAIFSANQLATVLKKSDVKNGVRFFLWRNRGTVYAFLQTGDE